MEINPIFLNLNEITNSNWGEFGEKGLPVKTTPLKSPIENFYMTDPISRASSTMAKCTETFSNLNKYKTKNNG